MAETASEGTRTVSTTEYYLVSASTTKTDQTTKELVQPFLDTTNLVAGDEIELRLYEKAISGGTQRSRVWPIRGPTEAIWAGPALKLYNGWEWSLKKISGTDRSVDYSIRRTPL